MKLSKFTRAGGGVFITLCAMVFALHLFADPRHIDPRSFLEHIRYLASDELEGRGDGSPGLEKAADYIGKSFAATGLEPAGDNGTFFQKFELVAGLSLLPGNAVTLNARGHTTTLQIGRDYDLLSAASDAGA